MDAAISCNVFRQHGGKVETARSLFPQVRVPWVDLSTGISPWAYPHDAPGPEAFTRLPDSEALAELEAAAAESFGVADPSRVVAAPGTDLALRLLGRHFVSVGGGAPTPTRSCQVAVVRPGYSGHALMWGSAPVTFIAADDIGVAARHHDIVLLANPNNPDGRLVERTRLLSVAAELTARSGVLVVDEAFADVAPEHSLCSSLRAQSADGIVLFRSFGKFYGLAGVRLGFVIASPPVARVLRHALGDWPVSGPAVAIGTAAYRDIAWQSMQRQRLASAAQRLDTLLIRAGLTIVGGTALFRLARCSDADAFFTHLAAHGILTRPFSGDRTLLRVGLPADESHWERLALALCSSRIQ